MTSPTKREAEIRARVEAATEGPWLREDEPSLAGYEDGRYECVTADVVRIVYIWQPGWAEEGRKPEHIKEGHNLDFIAHARSDIPWLLDRVEKLRDALNLPDVRRALEKIAREYPQPEDRELARAALKGEEPEG